jgi:2-polyprenyl-3-methyl-5-hydroxy-6-metoxy-1,4-benzoquinol methylase
LSCQTVFQDPRVIPEDLSLCYPSDYFTHAPANESDITQAAAISGARQSSQRSLARVRDRLRLAITASVQGAPQAGFSRLLGSTLALSRRLRERAFCDHVRDELLPRAQGRLRALEVGCGNGQLMLALQRVGYDVEGVEWDAAAADIARRATGSKVYNGDFRKVDLPKANYHLIVLQHVFEHLEEPLAALRRLKELLAPRGRLVLIYPNPESFGARYFKSFWFPWEAPRHLVLPSGRSLAGQAVELDLIPLKVTTSAHHSPSFFALSRAYKAGNAANLLRSEPGRTDRVMGYFARTLVRLGLFVGEEIVIVLENGMSGS